MAKISMIDAIGEPAMLEMLAEEASELTQADRFSTDEK